MRRTGRIGRRVGATAVAVVALGGAVAACGGERRPEASVTIEAGAPSATPTDVLARAADTTSTVQSGRMRMTATYDVEVAGRSTSMGVDATGVFTDGGERSQMEMTTDTGSFTESVTGAAGSTSGRGGGDIPSSFTTHVVQDGAKVYMKMDLDPPVPGVDGWYLVDDGDMGVDASDLDGPGSIGGGPTSYVESLRGAGADVTEAGRTSIDGVEVTRYEGTIDPRSAVERADADQRDRLRGLFDETDGLGSMPFTAFVDDDGALRRLELSMSVDADGLRMTVSTVVEYYDLGADVDVTVPPSDEVRSFSDLTALSGLGDLTA